MGHLRTLILAVVLLTLPVAAQDGNEHDEEDPGLGPPALYDALLEAALEPAGHITDGRLTIDRMEFELTDGDLYLLTLEEQPLIAVFLGEGLIRCYPPDGVEHQQLEKFIDDDDFLEEDFDRFVFWFSDDTGERLQALADDTPGTDADDAADLLEDRREHLREDQLTNPDGRVVVDLFNLESDAARTPARHHFYAQIDSDDHDWLTVEIEPRAREEVAVSRFDRRSEINEVWLGFHALWDFDEPTQQAALDGFPRDPEVEGKVEENDDDDDDWNARDLGLSPRPLSPHDEQWTPRVSVARTDVDLALEGDGDVTASAALVIEPLEPFSAFRLRFSPVLEVKDVRWKPLPPDRVEDVRRVPLLTGEAAERDEPVKLDGEAVHFIQLKHDRRMDDDLYEPWVSVVLPRSVAAGDPFVLELSYEGPLLEDLRESNGFFLKDSGYWMPRHADNRWTRMSLTYRMPERFRVASGTSLLEERVEEGTRIARWVSDDPIRSMSFNYGQFEVNEVTIDGLPPISVYADDNHRGFAPGARQKTMDDLVVSLQTYRDYFGPYPFDTLLVTETSERGAQAFPGLVLLTYQAFGDLYTGEAALFRSHEVAHQWWGAAIDWEDYRDKWIPEGFAQYSSALFTLTGLEDEEEFLDMLDAWRLDVLGEGDVGQGQGRYYGLPFALVRESDGSWSGPLVVGSRLVTSDSPVDYQLLIYEKGAFVLHMLRMMLTDLETGDDTRFRELMQTFAANHLFGVASTTSFEAVVTEAFGEPMDWFFDQWVYGVDVPTYRRDLDVSRTSDQDEPFVLHGTIRQEDVPSDFRMPVPIVVRFEDHPPLATRVWVQGKSVEVEIPLPAEPKDVEFNYHHGVLAQVR